MRTTKDHQMPRMPTTKKKLPLSAKDFPPAPQGKAFQLDLKTYYLRSLRKPDASTNFTEWMNDADVLFGLNLGAFNMTVPDLKHYIGTANNLTKYLIGIFTKPDMRLIGFYQIDVNLMHKRGSMTAAIGEKEMWGKSVLKETAPPLVESLFQNRGLDKISLRIVSKNKRILFSLMGTRFKHEGCLRQEVLTPSGERLDVNVFARMKNE